MFTVSKNKFLERLDLLPESIRNLAFSLEIGGVLRSIAEAHHLDPEKTDKVLALAAAVFFGFIHRTDLAREIEENVKLDAKIAQSITDEIARKIFSQVQAELDKFYQPILATEEAEDGEKEEREVKPQFSPLSFPAAPKITISPPPPPTGGTPFILHKERSLAEEAKKESFKGFSLPFGLFKPKQSEFAQGTRATIETPKKKPEEKVVHYSEYRTSIAPGNGGEFINLETFGKETRIDTNKGSNTNVTNKTPLITPASAPVPKESVIAIKKQDVPPPPAQVGPPPPKIGNGPKVEGNTVDLR